MKKKKMGNIAFASICGAVIAVVLAVLIVANVLLFRYESIVTIFLQQTNYEYIDETPEDQAGSIDTEYYKSNYSKYDADGNLIGYDTAKRDADDRALGILAESEGIVMLKNENGLPIPKGSKLSLFSSSTVDMLYGGGGSGSVEPSTCKDLKTAFEDGGYQVNQTLWQYYKDCDYRRGTNSVGEAPVSEYSGNTAIMQSINEYNDAAIVVISRQGREGQDFSTEPLRGEEATMLQLVKNEVDMIEFCNEHFDNVVVILNTGNPMELGYLEEFNNIKACLWVGYFGSAGIDALPMVISGDVNPSGHLSDTYAYDSLSAPAMQNFIHGVFSNDTVSKFPQNKGAYVVYAEGIYVGYKYYETRYEDAVLGTPNTGAYDYEQQVQFPFGYGLSYTTFVWSDFSCEETDDAYNISVTVTNGGNVAGKDVVQIYMQSPYTEYDKQNNIEKASVELVGFDKTGLINPGESEVVNINVSKEERRAYDAYSDQPGYILDAGTYYFTAAEDAHQAINNILLAKEVPSDKLAGVGYADMVFVDTVAEQDKEIYDASLTYGGEQGSEITNQFEKTDLKTYDSSFKYLSRSNWEGTWPTLYKERRWELPDDFAQQVVANTYAEDADAEMPLTNAGNGMVLLDMLGKDYGDPDWEKLLDNLNAEIMTELVRMGGWKTNAIPEIIKPQSDDIDGPAGISASLGGLGDSGARCLSVPSEILLASTWDVDLLKRIGEAIGEDGLTSGYEGWYAPGAGTHRGPYGGRNFEYYSEDGFLAGKLCAAEVAGVQSKGMYCYLKHIVLNDAEVMRYGITEFCNEQALREIYLVPFEISVREADCRGMMAAFNSLGPDWCGASEELLTNVLRNEWGFHGIVVTDYASANSSYMFIDAGLQAGCDLWLNTNADVYKLPNASDSATQMQMLRRATKNILYTVLNSAAMNGISPYTRINIVMPPWQKWLVALDVVVGVLAVGLGAFAALRCIRNKKQSAENQGQA